MMRKEYPSDISRKQFEIIKEDLKSVRKTTHPSTYDLYDIFCAVLYLLKEGCTWRAIPHDSRNGQRYGIIMTYGQRKMKTESVFLIKYCIN